MDPPLAVIYGSEQVVCVLRKKKNNNKRWLTDSQL